MIFSFKPFNQSDISKLYQWMRQPHVAQWWGESKLDEASFIKKYNQNMQRVGYSTLLVLCNNHPIGYIQYYDASKAGDGWWPDEPAGTYGFDILIGEPDYLGKGYGTEIVKKFTTMLFEKPEIRRIITDPQPNNMQAIRCFEKVGFNRVGLRKTPGGDAMVMELLKPSV